MSRSFGLSRFVGYALAHPLGSRQPVRTLMRMFAWQLRARPAIERRFADAGFVRRHYDPFTRRLSIEPVHAANNSLYIRDESFVQERLASARAAAIHGLHI